MTTHDSEKAKRYIGLLDTARCNGNWTEVPELVRKVNKHAPHRTCLTLTATTELKVVKHTSSLPNLKPSLASSQVPELAQSIPTLLSTIETESHPIGDIFQCQTCLAGIHWVLSEPGLAAARLPKNTLSFFWEISRVQDTPSDYTTVCMLRSIYIRGNYLSQEGDIAGSLEVFISVLPWMHEHEAKILSQPQFLFWSEQLLAQMAFTASDSIEISSSESDRRIDTALRAYRHWAILSAKGKEISRDEFGIARPVRRRIEIWQAYYVFLSKLLQHGIDHHILGETHTRLHQIAELRRVESVYEAELLRVNRFPKAHESNRAIEDWVEHVIHNWEILCGRSWPESELGEGGRNALGRNVLDILYRAATKTFHSTLILRRLFQVHKTLADFSLAYKALDSYLELVTRGKARAQKSHENPTSVDDDETVIRTISEGIEGLCTFGRKEEAEKALNLTTKLQEWTQDYIFRQPDIPKDQLAHSEPRQGDTEVSKADAQTLEIAYRAIGIGKAFWAMWTPASERRLTYQSEALESLKKAMVVLGDAPPSLETAYAQALLLAETRDLKRGIDCVKKVLTASNAQAAEHGVLQRRTMPFWHLLALLLSASQDFDTAYQMCDAAFDQLSDSSNHSDNQAASLSGGVSSNGEKGPLDDEMHGLVDDMDGRERERLIETKMTELALIELVEGAEEAVNGSNELLSLFSKLFGHLGVGRDEKQKQKGMIPPKSSAGTVKSFRGSIFGRRRHEPAISAQTADARGDSALPANNLVPYSDNTTEAPTIQITDENSGSQKQKAHSFRRSHSHNRSDSQSHKLHKREGTLSSIVRRHSRSATTRPTSSAVSSQRQSFETGPEHLSGRASTTGVAPHDVSQNVPVGQIGPVSNGGNWRVNANPFHSHNKAPEAKVPLRPMAHNIDHTQFPPPPGHEHEPPEQDVRLPILHSSTTSTQPKPRLPRTAEQIQAHGILVKVWLLVAGLYRRASLFEDSIEACDEASKSASQIEAFVAAQESSAAAFGDSGWGGGKSSNEVWADVHTERAYLALAKSVPHEAVKQFEEALLYSLDHPRATVGLSKILLDIYEQKIPSEPPRPAPVISALQEQTTKQGTPVQMQHGTLVNDGPAAPQAGDELRKTPENLNRLAARDRAYGLLSNLTKLGTSWDDSEAWYALARAHECGGQIEKAKEVLWWCVELEDKRPVRHWRNIGTGSYVL